MQAIEDFDEKVVGKVLVGLQDMSDYRVLLVTDHPTPLSTMTHADDPVPFAVFPSSGVKDSVQSFDEGICENGKIHFQDGYRLLEAFISGDVLA